MTAREPSPQIGDTWLPAKWSRCCGCPFIANKRPTSAAAVEILAKQVFMENEDKLLIEKLLALGREHAGKHLRNTGQMPALFFGFSDEDRVMLRPQTLEDAQDKLRFMSLARLICIAHDLDAVAFVAWVWAVEAAADEPPDTPPEESLYRKECVVVSCETRNSILQTVLLPVVRADNGAYFGLGEPEYSSTGSIQGRLTPFMPSHKPTESDRQRARQILQALTHEPPGGDN